MILSNTDILKALNAGDITIESLQGMDPSAPPFNTSAVDLRLGSMISVPNKQPGVHYRLDNPYDKQYMERNCENYTITDSQPYVLEPNTFILAQTLEKVSFLPRPGGTCYAARVEGKSSHARRGMLVHFTAPTIHSGFEGPITLEIINLGATSIALTPGIYICQLIIEQVSSPPMSAANQFSGQVHPSGAC